MNVISEKEIYRQFIDWLNRAWWGLPQSKYLMPTITAFYSTEEAALLTGIPLTITPLEEIAWMKGLDPVELGPKLDALARRGAVWRDVKGGVIRYKLNDTMFTFLRGPFWAKEPHQATKALSRPLNKYFYDGFMDQFATSRTKGLRTIPIHRTIEDRRRILPYEDVAGFVDSQDYCTVSYCPCRQRKTLDPDSDDCRHPVEVCLHFGQLGHYIVDNGLGREISKKEAEDVLKEAAEAGLVHAISNWQRGADTICNCCKCCCLFFEAYHVLKHDKSHDASNYCVRTFPETCKGCGLCIERCPMDALKLEEHPSAKNTKGQVAVADTARCIGCGACVYKCPTQSLVLKQRETIYPPPEDPREWIKRWAEDVRSPLARAKKK